MQKITITQPDDWHCHLRDGVYLETTVRDVARQFCRAIIMPNLVSPVINIEIARAYFNRIQQWLPKKKPFHPLMTLYLTDNTTVETIIRAKAAGIVHGCKLYPQGATTHSDCGVTNLKNLHPVFKVMSDIQMPLLIHGESIIHGIDIFDRESSFIKNALKPLTKSFPDLKIVLEHITTREAVDFVLEATANIAATITAHHLLLNRNDIFEGGINPHYYCLPILKRHCHQQVLLEAATSGNPKFFLGTDSAPHTIENKECDHGCAGIYSMHAAIELYAEAFDHVNALDKLEGFASFYGADFYGLQRNQQKITLVGKPWQVPNNIKFGNDKLVPLWAGKKLKYRKLDSAQD